MTSTQATSPTFADVKKESREDTMLSALTSKSPLKVSELFVPTRMTRKSAALPSAIRRSLAAESNTAIMFASAYGREGAPGVAFQTARSASLQTSGKVLYVHVSRRIPEFFRSIHNKIPVTLDDFANGRGGNVLPFIVLDESGLVCAWYRGRGEYVNPENLKVLVDSLQQCFDFTVFGGDEMLTEGVSVSFSDIVDGIILVTEAERTRAPVARRLKQKVEENGGKVIGAILNRRKFHIPEWIYQLLYGGY